MKTAIVFLGLLVVTNTLFAQGMRQHRQFYDTSTVTTITGTIASVDSQAAPRGNFYMVRLTVQDTTSLTSVSVGPSSYLDSQGVSFNKGDSIQVTGSKVSFNGNEIVIAAKIVSSGKTTKLRDDSGQPVWARGMR